MIRSGDLDGELDRHAGLVESGDLSEVLSLASDAFDRIEDGAIEGINPDELPSSFEDTEFFQALVTPEATERATDATDAHLPQFLTGSDSSEKSKEMRALMELSSLIRPDGRVVVFGGGTNSGKTNSALLLVECAQLQFADELQIATNIESLAEDTGASYIANFSDLQQWSTQDGPKIFIGDEMSSHAKAGSQDSHHVVEKMGPLCRMAAKRSLRVVSLGHRPTDLHPDVRKMPGMRYIECRRIEDDLGQPLRYELSIYEEIDDDGSGVHQVLRIPTVPETSLQYDPDEETGWSWE
jgi:hypothetical protein